MSDHQGGDRVAPDCPRWTDADLALAVQEAHQAGYLEALRLTAERVDELDAVWAAVPRPSWEEQVAQRRALFEACAVEMAAQLDARRSGAGT